VFSLKPGMTMNPEAKLFQKVSLQKQSLEANAPRSKSSSESSEAGGDEAAVSTAGVVDERTARSVIAALRAEMAEEFEEIRRDMISSLSAEREARAALSRRVYDLAHELSEEKCLRETDAQRAANLETKFARLENSYKHAQLQHQRAQEELQRQQQYSRAQWGGPPQESADPLLQNESPSSYHRLVAEARPLVPLAETQHVVEAGSAAVSHLLPPPPPLTAEALRHLEDEILALCDAAPLGAVLCANLPRQYYYRYRKQLDFRALGFMKMSQLLAKMDRLQVSGSHRAQVTRKTEDATTAPVTEGSDSASESTSEHQMLAATSDADARDAAYSQFWQHRVKKLESTCKSLEFQLQLAVNKQHTWRSMMHTNPY